MANLVVIDGAGDTKYLKAAGAGTDGDPHIPDQTISLPTGASTAAAQASALTQLEAIVTALGGTLTVDAGTVTVTLATLPDTAAGDLAAIVAALGGTLTVDGSGVTQPVSVATLPALAAGTNNIGDVDVLTLPAVQIAEKTIATAVGTFATSGDNTLVAAPGVGNRLVLVAWKVQNESTTSTTLLLKHGSTTIDRALLKNQGDGVAWQYPPGRELKLGENAALIGNLSGANSHNYHVRTYTEAV